jgi:2-dehydro-3-deoxygluconokinase
MSSRIVCFGELLLRLSGPPGERLLQSARLDACFGGAEANVAVSLARFGNAAAMVSIVPASALGDAAVAELRRHGVDTSGVLRGAGRMGLYFLEPAAGLRSAEVLYDRTGSAFALAPADAIDWDAGLDGARWLHVSGITPAVGERAAEAAGRAVRAAAARGVGVSFDGNYRERLWAQSSGAPKERARAILRELLDHARIAFVNDKDVALILGLEFRQAAALERRRAAARAAFDAFPRLERGPDAGAPGALAATLSGRRLELVSRGYELPATVDRVGSGDAFAAGVLHGIVAGLPDEDVLELGAAAAALKHSIRGDFNLIGLADVEALLRAPSTDIRR